MTRGSFCRSEPAAALRGLANGGLALLDHRGVEVGERGDREVDLAAHLQPLGQLLARQLLRDVVHRADVGGDVLAGDAVAAGGRADQPAVLVEQGDGEPVDLQLAQPAHAGAGVPLDAGGPRLQLLAAEDVVQALHPLQVLHRGERRRRTRR